MRHQATSHKDCCQLYQVKFMVSSQILVVDLVRPRKIKWGTGSDFGQFVRLSLTEFSLNKYTVIFSARLFLYKLYFLVHAQDHYY